MEYMEHGDLQGYLSRPFHEKETKQIIFQLLEGLCFMHDNGFAHRDLKPAVGYETKEYSSTTSVKR